MLKHIVLTALSISLLTACGNKDDDEEEKSGRDYCDEVCQKADECVGPPDTYLDDCEDTCAEAFERAREAGCRDEFESLARCGSSNFECDADDLICEAQAEDYASCVVG